MITPPNRNSLQNSSLARVIFLERCWQLEMAKQQTCRTSVIESIIESVIEIDETTSGSLNSRTRIAVWVPLIWLYL